MKRLAKGKLVPEHRYDLWYYTGGITLFLFIVQFMTGMLMALYYVPHIDFAYKSIIEIVTKLNMGWFFRSLPPLGGAAGHRLSVHPPLRHAAAEVLPQAAGIRLGDRIHPPGHLDLLRPERLSAALGRARLCRRPGGDGRGRRLSRHRVVHQGLSPGEHRCDRRHPPPLLRLPCGHPADHHPGADRGAHPPGAVPRDERPPLAAEGESGGRSPSSRMSSTRTWRSGWSSRGSS